MSNGSVSTKLGQHMVGNISPQNLRCCPPKAKGCQVSFFFSLKYPYLREMEDPCPQPSQRLLPLFIPYKNFLGNETILPESFILDPH